MNAISKGTRMVLGALAENPEASMRIEQVRDAIYGTCLPTRRLASLVEMDFIKQLEDGSYQITSAGLEWFTKWEADEASQEFDDDDESEEEDPYSETTIRDGTPPDTLRDEDLADTDDSQNWLGLSPLQNQILRLFAEEQHAAEDGLSDEDIRHGLERWTTPIQSLKRLQSKKLVRFSGRLGQFYITSAGLKLITGCKKATITNWEMRRDDWDIDKRSPIPKIRGRGLRGRSRRSRSQRRNSGCLWILLILAVVVFLAGRCDNNGTKPDSGAVSG